MLKKTKESKKNKKVVGVIGLGMVGGQVLRWFKSKGYRVFSYDKYKNTGSLAELHKTEIIFVCLPTPYVEKSRTGVDNADLMTVFSFFKNPKFFVVKSTVPPGSTNYFQNRFKRHYFFHNPEFLTEATAWEDFSRPFLQLLGCTKKSRHCANKIMNILPPSKNSGIIMSEQAEIFKYARNSFFATKVIFANQIYDLCKAYGVDYDVIKKFMLVDPWIGGNHLNIIHKGYRGFGGKCLPKDLKTLIKSIKAKDIDPVFFKVVDDLNTGLLKKQKLIQTLKETWLLNRNKCV